MRRLLNSFVLSLGFVAFSGASAMAGDPAIICKSDSTGACKGRQYCCYAGMSSSAGDKYCKDLGCKRGGTGSCPTAANVTSCGTRNKASELDLPWCIDPAVAQYDDGTPVME